MHGLPERHRAVEGAAHVGRFTDLGQENGLATTKMIPDGGGGSAMIPALLATRIQK